MKTEHANCVDGPLTIKTLKNGGVVAIPTETVYGLACLASNKKAFDALCQVKRRPADKPFSLMCSSVAEAVRYTTPNAKAVAVMKAFLPGELTLLLKARPGMNQPHVDLNTGVVGIRVPNEKSVLSLIEEIGEPLLVTSANISGEEPAKDFQQTVAMFEGAIDLIVEGECGDGVPTTIIDLAGDEPKLVREGKLRFDEIKTVYDAPPPSIALGSDHGGFRYKEIIRFHLKESGYDVIDEGTYSSMSCDYPEYAKAVSQDIVSGSVEFGILFCTSGIGISIAANKVRGIRCGLGYCDEVVIKMREHNNANTIAFGQKYMEINDVIRRVDMFLAGQASKSEKHVRRVNNLED